METRRRNFSLLLVWGEYKRTAFFFKYSEIVKKFTLGRDKVAYIISFGLATFFKTKILDQMCRPTAQIFTTSFDEAFNSIVNKNQYDVHVTFFNDCTGQVRRQYLRSSFFGHLTAKDISKSLENGEVSEGRWFDAREILCMSPRDFRTLDVRTVITAATHLPLQPIDLVYDHVFEYDPRSRWGRPLL